MRFWDPRRAAAYRIVEDAVAFYGAGRVRVLADHFASPSSPTATKASTIAEEESRSQFARQQDEQTYVLYTKLKNLSESSGPMFENVRRELERYSSNSQRVK